VPIPGLVDLSRRKASANVTQPPDKDGPVGRGERRTPLVFHTKKFHVGPLRACRTANMAVARCGPRRRPGRTTYSPDDSDTQRRVHMAFVQIIEFRSSKPDEIKKTGDEWEAAAAGGRKARRRIFCEDRDNAGRYLNIVFFDSYEEAMENSNLPATQEFSKKMMALADGPPTFYNLNVLDDQE
jgi:hypothetical protein